MSTTERVDVAAIIAGLAELCPKAVFVYERRRRPLKIGIYEDLAAKVAGSITPDELKLALRTYTRNPGYLRAMRVLAPCVSASMAKWRVPYHLNRPPARRRPWPRISRAWQRAGQPRGLRKHRHRV
jgi:hypothetical protein